MAKRKRVFKVYVDDFGRCFVWVYRDTQWKCYPQKIINLRRMYLISRLIAEHPGFTVRPYVGEGTGYVAMEN